MLCPYCKTTLVMINSNISIISTALGDSDKLYTVCYKCPNCDKQFIKQETEYGGYFYFDEAHK